MILNYKIKHSVIMNNGKISAELPKLTQLLEIHFETFAKPLLNPIQSNHSYQVF